MGEVLRDGRVDERDADRAATVRPIAPVVAPAGGKNRHAQERDQGNACWGNALVKRLRDTGAFCSGTRAG